MVPFTYSRVAGVRAASACERVDTTFEKFAESLNEPDIRTQKDGPAIVLARFGDKTNPAGNVRWDGNVIAMTGFALDFDTGVTEQEIRTGLQTYMYAAHTTYSHSEAQAKWRVIVPFAQTAPPNAARALFD